MDTNDPLNLGRIRVQVPQILGTAASGWAFPAWSFHSLTVWPKDRLPKPGDGVWIMFDSTSPDKMIWTSAFGPVALINQPGFAPDPEFVSEVTIEIDAPPVWNEVSTFFGILSSSGGQPNPNPYLSLWGRVAGGNWEIRETDIEPDVDGRWTVDHKVTLFGDLEYRAVFDGVGVFSSATSETLEATVAEVSLSTSLTIEMTDPDPALNKMVPFSGKLLTLSDPPLGYEVPGPGAPVSLREKSGDYWTTVQSGIPVDESSGDWSTMYKISVAGSVEYQATFDGLGPFTSSSTFPLVVDTTKGTTVSPPSLPPLYHGTGFNVSGTIKDADGAVVTSGTVELWYRKTTGSNQNWYKVVGPANVTNGTYSLTHPVLSFIGACQFYVKYNGSAAYDPAQSATVSSTSNLRGNGALTKGTVSHSSAAFSWAAVSGATQYEVIRSVNGGGYGTLESANTTRSVNNTGVSTSTTYAYQVRPKGQDAAGTWFYGAYSAAITMNTGRPAQNDSGTTAWIRVTVVRINCHRIDLGWGYPSAPRFYQGFYASSYDGEGYIGIATYTGTRVRDAIIADCGGGTLGNTRWSKGSCTEAEIQLKRGNASGDGQSGGSVNIGFSTTMSAGTGGRPVRDGTTVSVDSTSANAGSFTWHAIGAAHGDRIGRANANSIAIYRNSKTNYANFDVEDLRVKWTWNYTSVSYIAPSWS